MLRSPVVNGRFYPGSPDTLRKDLDDLIPLIEENEKINARAIVCPHAGYMYSGGVAGETVARVNIPKTVVIIGPNHRIGMGAPLSLGLADWSMPLGEVPIRKSLARDILERSTVIVHDEIAHRKEHSLEVQVPFLQYLQKNLTIVPIAIAYNVSLADCRRAATDLAAAIKAFNEPVLVLASTDMNHEEPREIAAKKDRLAIERIKAIDPAGLYETVRNHNITMCGMRPTTITLLTALELGATKAELVHYTDSAEANGDTSRVVGYAGFVIT